MKKGKFVTSRKQPTEDPVCLEKAKIDTVYRILTGTSDKNKKTLSFFSSFFDNLRECLSKQDICIFR